MSEPPVHVRTIRVGVRRAGPDQLEITGHLVDERPGARPTWFGLRHDSVVHDMTLTVRVRYPELVVTAASGHMAAHPYTLCPEALPPLAQLVGLSVVSGFTRAVNERLGRARGCAHLTALVHAMAPVVRQGAGAAFRDESRLPEAGQDRWFVNSCHAWREDGPLAARLRAGDLEGLRRLTTRKPAD